MWFGHDQQVSLKMLSCFVEDLVEYDVAILDISRRINNLILFGEDLVGTDLGQFKMI